MSVIDFVAGGVLAPLALWAFWLCALKGVAWMEDRHEALASGLPARSPASPLLSETGAVTRNEIPTKRASDRALAGR